MPSESEAPRILGFGVRFLMKSLFPLPYTEEKEKINYFRALEFLFRFSYSLFHVINFIWKFLLYQEKFNIHPHKL